MDLNLDLLAHETIQLSLTFGQEFDRGFDGRYLDSNNAVEEEQQQAQQEKQQEEISRTNSSGNMGVAFRIERGAQTFCIRAVAIDEMDTLANQLHQGDQALYQALRIQEIEQLQEVMTFETENLGLAEVIIDHLGNRRFPYAEDTLFNLSDPGFSWWLDIGPRRLQVFFQSHGIDRGQRYYELGPLGDGKIAARRMAQLLPFLQKKLSISEFASDSRGFTLGISSTQKEPLFEAVKDLLVEGKKFDESEIDDKTLIFFLDELSALRQFWLAIEELL